MIEGESSMYSPVIMQEMRMAGIISKILIAAIKYCLTSDKNLFIHFNMLFIDALFFILIDIHIIFKFSKG